MRQPVKKLLRLVVTSLISSGFSLMRRILSEDSGKDMEDLMVLM
jgi:hypothetical protein